MNPEHQNLCASPEWAGYLQSEILPAVTAGIELGEDMLEIGPGPGAATGWLAGHVAKLTALESDGAAAALLAERYCGDNITVDTGDATQMPYPDGAFDAVASFTMLHHVPTAAAQHQILAEALRVLRARRHALGFGQPGQRQPAPLPRWRHLQPAGPGDPADLAAHARVQPSHHHDR